MRHASRAQKEPLERTEGALGVAAIDLAAVASVVAPVVGWAAVEPTTGFPRNAQDPLQAIALGGRERGAGYRSASAQRWTLASDSRWRVGCRGVATAQSRIDRSEARGDRSTQSLILEHVSALSVSTDRCSRERQDGLVHASGA